MLYMVGKPKFTLGQVVATPGALEAFRREVAAHGITGVSPATILNRHQAGDWGDVCADDKRANDAALTTGQRVLSAYTLKSGERLWVITEWDRSVTTVLLPDEY